MKISSFLVGWGAKRENSDERRKEPRYSAEGPMKAYWSAAGGITSARGQLHDAGEGGSGVGFVLPEQIPVGTAHFSRVSPVVGVSHGTAGAGPWQCVDSAAGPLPVGGGERA
jgi:hypothetical protein